MAGGGGGDEALLPVVEDDVFHEAHALADAGFEDVAQALGFAVADEGDDGGVGDEEFAGEDEAAVGCGEEPLAEDAAETFGDGGADLGLLRRWEDVEQTVERGGGVAGVHGADDEVAGFGGGDGHLDGFEVAEFADDDDVGVFAEGALEGGGEGGGVGADLALGEVAAEGGLDDFDGVLDGDDVVLAGFVEGGDEGGEGGGFAGAGGAGDEDEPVVVAEEFLDGDEVAQAEFVEFRDTGGDHAVGAGGAGLVEHEVDAVAGASVEG